MKNILKILIYLFIIIGCISCNNKAKEPNTIKFWHFWSEPNQKRAVADLIAVFEKENNCKVELTELSWNDGKTKLIAAFNSGVAPDVLELGADWVSQFSSKDILSEINPDSVDMGNFIDLSLPPAKWNSKYYAVPWTVDTRVMFYNKSLMQAAGLDTIPPQDYSQLLDEANIINNPEKEIYGFGANGSDPHRLYKKILPMFWTFNGDVFDSTGNPVLNSSRNCEALIKYVQLSRAGIIETQRQIDSYFVQGKIGFMFSGSWVLEKIKNENPSLNFGAALMPRYMLNPGISFLGAEYLAVNKKSDKQQLGMKLIKYLANGKSVIELAKRFSEAGFPADKKYFNDSIFTQDRNKSIFAQQLLSAKPTLIHPKWLDIEAIIENAVSEALLGKKGEQAALNDAQIEILKLLNEE